MIAKERHKIKLLEYLGNPENDFPNKVYMNDVVLGFKGIQNHIGPLFKFKVLR
jgi:hypothetical protein